MSGRFQRYYVEGSTESPATACAVWKENFQDCKSWITAQDEDAFVRKKTALNLRIF